MSDQAAKTTTSSDQKDKPTSHDQPVDKSIAPRKGSLETDKDLAKGKDLENEDKGDQEEIKELDPSENGRRGSKKVSSIPNLDTDKKQAGSPEFGSLKDIDGNVIHHDESEEDEQEDPNQKVHFNLENTEEGNDHDAQPVINKKPRKSILKKSLSFRSTGGSDKKETQADGSDQPNEGKSAEPAQEQHIKDSIEFLTAWKEMKHDLSTLERFFLNRAPPEDFKTIFAHGIEPELLSEIIATTNDLSGINSALALKVLEKLTEIHDFEEASKSLTDKEKIDIHTIFLKLRANLGLGEESLASVSGKYLA